jgi:hypothetical protein
MEGAGFKSDDTSAKITQKELDRIINTFPPRQLLTKDRFMLSIHRINVVEDVQILYDDIPELSLRVQLKPGYITMSSSVSDLSKVFKTLKEEYMIEGYTKIEFTFICKEVIE